MVSETLNEQEKQELLKLARRALENAAAGKPLPSIDLFKVSERLQEPGASFVTLTIHDGQLRGCIGALEAYQPLVLDVVEHTAAAALDDPRFYPVRPAEVPQIKIEISRLTSPQPLDYEDAQDLLSKIRPHVDGLILRDGLHRATYLPQVWEKIPSKPEFLDSLCLKMGAPADSWRRKKLTVLTYQVEEFHE